MGRKRINCRKLYESHYGKVPSGYEVHHIIPTHCGGLDVIENLEVLSVEEHKQRHLDLYLENGNFRDLCAYHMLNYNYSEAHRISASNGGQIGGAKTRDLKLGIHARDEETIKADASKGGKVGGRVQVEKGLGIHAQTREERLEILKDARLKQKDLGILMWNSDFQSEQGKKGGVKNKGFKWYTDGQDTYKYTAKQQEILSFDKFLIDNPQYKKGRK